MRFGLFRVAGMRLVFPESQRHAVESTELIFRKSQDGKRPSQRTARRLLLGDRNRWPALPPAQWVERLQNGLMNFLNLPFDFRTRFIYRLPPACFEQNDFGLLFFWQTFMPSRIFSCRPLPSRIPSRIPSCSVHRTASRACSINIVRALLFFGGPCFCFANRISFNGSLQRIDPEGSCRE